MLTDTKLRNFKPQDKLYKGNDRDGLYVAITKAGSISFRYYYSINGRQECNFASPADVLRHHAQPRLSLAHSVFI